MSSTGTIGTRELVALAKLASVDETRRPIMCLRFESDGKQMLAIATDGRRIGVLRLKADVPHGSTPFAVNIQAAAFSAALSACLDLGPLVTMIHVDTSTVRILGNDLSVEIPAARVTYPDWRKVFDIARGKVEYTAFNVELADGFRELAQEMGLLESEIGEDESGENGPSGHGGSEHGGRLAEESPARDMNQVQASPTVEAAFDSNRFAEDCPARDVFEYETLPEAEAGSECLSECEPGFGSESRCGSQQKRRWQNAKLRFNPKSRYASRAQRTELLRRDGWCCRTPGCPNRVWLHLHHVHEYAQGGETSPDNLLSLCSGCHRNVHRGALNITELPSGKLLYCDAEGRRLDSQADLQLAGWLDHHLGWRGEELDSHRAQLWSGEWAMFSS